ncbi:aconitase family protein [Caballeronia sp. LjRoot31]|uniref:aconitase family protein n=1 Tax=Caballeronia sp. LjRoot31 TaxID=3342324 RepID=UPI003ECD8DEE
MSMPPMTLVEKVLARAAGLPAVSAGEVIWAEPDIVTTHDLNYERHRKMLQGLGYANIARPETVFATIDHTTHSASDGHLGAHQFMREDTRAQNVRWFLDIGRQGISHNAPLDLGIVKPGMLLVAADTRAPALGCTGAIAVALGLSVTTALATGKVWLRVPETLLVTLDGMPRPGVMSRDIGQWIAARIGAEKGDYRCIEFTGPYVEDLDEDGRHTLCNAMVDIGVKAAVCTVTDASGVRWASDPGAVFLEALRFDVSAFDMLVCLPPDPQNVAPLSEHLGRPITSAFVGSCIGGKMEDLRAAARVLDGRRVAPGVRLTVIAATQAIFQKALEEGLIGTMSAAGADVSAGICGPCYGTYAPVGETDIAIGTATRNDHGRLGHARAPVYLANAAVVAASAVRGCIASPLELVEEAIHD